MNLRNKLILISGSILAALGFLIPKDKLLLVVGEKGEFYLPLSSGSEDPLIIKIALCSYIISIAVIVLSSFFEKIKSYIFGVYLANSALYLLLLILVSLDSNIFSAAKYGNWLPVLQFGVWLLSIVLIIWQSFKAKSR